MFSEFAFCLVGCGRIGENFLQCSPVALDRLDRRIEERAKLEPRLKQNDETGQFEPRPSAYRSELSGIENIRIPGPADRVVFSARDAAEWLSRPDTLGGYVVEFFRPDVTLDPHAVEDMINGFRQRLERLRGIVALPLFLGQSSRSSRGISPFQFNSLVITTNRLSPSLRMSRPKPVQHRASLRQHCKGSAVPMTDIRVSWNKWQPSHQPAALDRGCST